MMMRAAHLPHLQLQNDRHHAHRGQVETTRPPRAPGGIASGGTPGNPGLDRSGTRWNWLETERPERPETPATQQRKGRFAFAPKGACPPSPCLHLPLTRCCSIVAELLSCSPRQAPAGRVRSTFQRWPPRLAFARCGAPSSTGTVLLARCASSWSTEERKARSRAGPGHRAPPSLRSRPQPAAWRRHSPTLGPAQSASCPSPSPRLRSVRAPAARACWEAQVLHPPAKPQTHLFLQAKAPSCLGTKQKRCLPARQPWTSP